MRSLQLKLINPVPDCSLFAISLITQGFQQTTWRRYIGVHIRETYSVYEHNFLKWYLPNRLWRRFGQALFDAICRSKRLNTLIYREHKRLGDQLYRWSERVLLDNLKRRPMAVLQATFWKGVEDFRDICLWGGGIAAVDFENNYLTGWLEQRITAAAQRYAADMTPQELLSLLTTPQETTFSQQEKEDLLRLATRRTVTETQLKEHWIRYNWTEYGYIGPVHPLSYYRTRVRMLRHVKKPPNRQLSEIQRGRRQVIALQQKHTKTLRLDRQTRYLLDVARTFMFLKLYRKEIMFKALYAFNAILGEVARRTNYTVPELQYCLPQEVAKIMDGRKVSHRELRQRQTSIFMHTYIQEATRVINRFSYGTRVKAFIERNVYREKIDLTVREVSGMAAYLGKVTGSVRIVNEVKEMDKVRSGDILVSIATSPNILPAMAKAAAFVTDTGGVTCHAAIVSREMKKPCVIGTKIATRVFKDGDKVEVDATAGTVKKIT